MSSPASNPRLRINSGVVIAQSMYLQWKKRRGREGGGGEERRERGQGENEHSQGGNTGGTAVNKTLNIFRHISHH